MTCATCGATLTGTARFCASCGAPRPPPSDARLTIDAPREKKPEAKVAIQVVDPLAMTAPDAFAETANAETRAVLERALAAYDAKQRGGATTPGGPAPPPVATQEMNSVPSALASPQVSPKAASHVVPVHPQTAAMPASAHKLAAAPLAPVVHDAQGGSPQARIPMAPGSSGGMPALGEKLRPSGPPAVAMPGVAGAPPRLSPLPVAAYPPPIGGRPTPLAPGLTVSVTWATGQRYRGTIVQLMGTRVLVVFPDGQQHWVEMSYITPA